MGTALVEALVFMGGYFGPDIIIATSVVNGHYGNNDFGRLQSIDPMVPSKHLPISFT